MICLNKDLHMTTIQTKTINFKIVDNPNINHIQDQQGTLYIKVTISFEKSDTYDSSYYGYYDMQVATSVFWG